MVRNNLKAVVAAAVALFSVACGGTPAPTASPVDVGAGSLNGAGATFPEPFYTKAFYQYSQKYNAVTVNRQLPGDRLQRRDQAVHRGHRHQRQPGQLLDHRPGRGRQLPDRQLLLGVHQEEHLRLWQGQGPGLPLQMAVSDGEAYGKDLQYAALPNTVQAHALDQLKTVTVNGATVLK